MTTGLQQYMDEQLDVFLSQVGLDNIDFLVKVHRELLKGMPLSKEKFYTLANVAKEKADKILEKLGEFNDQGFLIAFSGLSILPTNHKFEVDGKTMYTWCALDAIYFTYWLDVNAHIYSKDPIDKSPIEVRLEGDYLMWTKPYPLFIPWLETFEACNIRSTLCDNVSFLASEVTADQWLNHNPHGKVFSIEDFFESQKIVTVGK